MTKVLHCILSTINVIKLIAYVTKIPLLLFVPLSMYYNKKEKVYIIWFKLAKVYPPFKGITSKNNTTFHCVGYGDTPGWCILLRSQAAKNMFCSITGVSNVCPECGKHYSYNIVIIK